MGFRVTPHRGWGWRREMLLRMANECFRHLGLGTWAWAGADDEKSWNTEQMRVVGVVGTWPWLDLMMGCRANAGAGGLGNLGLRTLSGAGDEKSCNCVANEGAGGLSYLDFGTLAGAGDKKSWNSKENEGSDARCFPPH